MYVAHVVVSRLGLVVVGLLVSGLGLGLVVVVVSRLGGLDGLGLSHGLAAPPARRLVVDVGLGRHVHVDVGLGRDLLVPVGDGGRVDLAGVGVGGGGGGLVGRGVRGGGLGGPRGLVVRLEELLLGCGHVLGVGQEVGGGGGGGREGQEEGLEAEDAK